MSILFKGNLEEGNYTLIKSTDGWVLKGETSYAGFNFADRPQGEWIRDRYWSKGMSMGEEYGFFYKCSLCEYEVEDGYTKCGFNFCPYCGADMRKGADDESG